jgi:hypothetical protein
MRYLLTGLSTLVGFVFTLGGPWNITAQESRSNTTGTVVIARQSPSMTAGWYDGQQQKLRTVLAATKDDPPPPKDTKPTKKSKSPQKHR